MKIRIGADVNINVNALMAPVRSDKFWKFAAMEWHRLYKDWVPMKEGDLYNQVRFAPKEITHTAPYAHYMYEGKVYGPNIPLYEGDHIAGYFSQPNRKKKPTGKSLKFSRQYHDKACARWDQAAAPVQGQKLADALKDYLKKQGGR